jgi:hypothetical protein
MTGCEKEYTQIQKKDLNQVFIINSSPTFQGYYYQGSDHECHYFTSRCQYQKDKKLKISKSDLKVARELDFGSDEIRITLYKLNNTAPLFCKIDNITIYEAVAKK